MLNKEHAGGVRRDPSFGREGPWVLAHAHTCLGESNGLTSCASARLPERRAKSRMPSTNLSSS